VAQVPVIPSIHSGKRISLAEFEMMLGNITRFHLRHKNVFSHSTETDDHQNNHHVDVAGLLYIFVSIIFFYWCFNTGL
jgi:hypothetical protein